MLRSLIVTILFAPLLVIAGCVGSARLQSIIPDSSWTVERVVYPTGRVVHGDGEEISFHSDGSLHMTSCNQCSGEYQLRGGAIEISPGPCTLMACPEGTIELESIVVPAVNAQMDGEYLILTPEGEEEGPRIMLLPSGDAAGRAP